MNTYNDYYTRFERGFFGNCTLGILGSSCLGGIAAMSVLQNGTSFFQMFQLFIVVVSCMLFNGAVLSQQKPKVVFNLLLWSITACTVLALVNFAR